MPFKPGQSGNPGGKLRAVQEVLDLARGHGPEAIEVLVSIMRDSSAAAPARVTAATQLLDRGFGKPKQTVEATGSLAIQVVTGIERAPDDNG